MLILVLFILLACTVALLPFKTLHIGFHLPPAYATTMRRNDAVTEDGRAIDWNFRFFLLVVFTVDFLFHLHMHRCSQSDDALPFPGSVAICFLLHPSL